MLALLAFDGQTVAWWAESWFSLSLMLPIVSGVRLPDEAAIGEFML
jgi:hypothetical protein